MRHQFLLLFGTTVLLISLVQVQSKFQTIRMASRNQVDINNNNNKTNKEANDTLWQTGAKQDTILEGIKEFTALLRTPTDDDSNITQVSSTEELHQALRDATEGSTIRLSAGSYIGPFNLNQDSITIQGSDDTIIYLDEEGTASEDIISLQITGDNCLLENLRFISYLNNTRGIRVNGSGNGLTNIKFEGFTDSLQVHGKQNSFYQISIKNCPWGFFINGNENGLLDIQLENVHKVGINIGGHDNEVYALTCLKCGTCFDVDGNDNMFNNVHILNSRNPGETWKFHINSGDGNLINYLRCDDDYCLHLGEESTNSVIRNSDCPRVQLEGTGHTLVNVDAGPQLTVRGSGHRILESKAKKLIRQEGVNVQQIESAFDEEEYE